MFRNFEKKKKINSKKEEKIYVIKYFLKENLKMNFKKMF